MENKKIICPFCHSSDIRSFNNNNMNHSSNQENADLYSCLNCGCAFKKDDKIDDWHQPTEITKEEFFAIILTAINDVFGPFADLDLQKRKIENMYKGIIKTYYKEIAVLQAEAFYEADSEYEEYHFFNEFNKKIN